MVGQGRTGVAARSAWVLALAGLLLAASTSHAQRSPHGAALTRVAATRATAAPVRAVSTPAQPARPEASPRAEAPATLASVPCVKSITFRVPAAAGGTTPTPTATINGLPATLEPLPAESGTYALPIRVPEDCNQPITVVNGTATANFQLAQYEPPTPARSAGSAGESTPTPSSSWQTYLPLALAGAAALFALLSLVLVWMLRDRFHGFLEREDGHAQQRPDLAETDDGRLDVVLSQVAASRKDQREITDDIKNLRADFREFRSSTARAVVAERSREPAHPIPAASPAPSLRASQPLPPKPPVTASFESRYNAVFTSPNSGDDIPGLQPPTLVNFRNPDQLDRNPDAVQPLVADGMGWLAVFPDPNLPPNHARLAPALSFRRGALTRTHTRLWTHLFESIPEGAVTRLVAAAVVERRGGEYVLKTPGRLA